jgi:hypothetical protein
MLCQLLCLDRRYQRMNCFNIREVEALLKGRFFPDLVNSHDYRLLLHRTILKLRFKTNDLSSINTNVFLFNSSGVNSFGSKKSYVHTSLFSGDDVNQSFFLDYTSSLIDKFILKEVFDFLKAPTLLIFVDGQLFLSRWFFYQNSYEGFANSGVYKYTELLTFFKHYMMSTVERQNLILVFLFDFSKLPLDHLN